jgi:class 3 adenylate cyclase
MKKLFTEIETLIEDALSTTLVYLPTKTVPTVEDSQLTFGFGSDKKGKIINTCVLYVDIRNSVGLVKKHQFNTMGKIYSAFTTIVLKIAQNHNANVRNIIGDRVMLVFPEEDCVTNAINAAISINQAAQLLDQKYTTVDFKCGIGIDFGEMKILKVGIKKPGTENYDNKNLVWVGYPANHASRLTDIANKTIEKTDIIVKLKRWNLAKYLPSASALSSLVLNSTDEYIFDEKTISENEFMKQMSIDKYGKMRFQFSEVIEYKRIDKPTVFPPILITKKVYDRYKTHNPKCNTITDNFWKKINFDFSEIGQEIYGGNVIHNI